MVSYYTSMILGDLFDRYQAVTTSVATPHFHVQLCRFSCQAGSLPTSRTRCIVLLRPFEGGCFAINERLQFAAQRHGFCFGHYWCYCSPDDNKMDPQAFTTVTLRMLPMGYHHIIPQTQNECYPWGIIISYDSATKESHILRVAEKCTRIRTILTGPGSLLQNGCCASYCHVVCRRAVILRARVAFCLEFGAFFDDVQQFQTQRAHNLYSAHICMLFLNAPSVQDSLELHATKRVPHLPTLLQPQCQLPGPKAAAAALFQLLFSQQQYL